VGPESGSAVDGAGEEAQRLARGASAPARRPGGWNSSSQRHRYAVLQAGASRPGARPLPVGVLLFAALAIVCPRTARAQEQPYFVTYTHHMEEPGSLEIAINPLLASQRHGDGFAAAWLELEYGVRGWWTTELYLDGQSTRGDSTILTGWRWENRFRPLLEEHLVNPVLYLEYEDTSAADKTMIEVVGHDVEADHAGPNREASGEHERELETKLILSSQVRDWNVAFNAIGEKNLAGEPWEFGYALGVNRPLRSAASPIGCTFCPEDLAAGVELYGGLGDQHSFGLKDTSHYFAPVLAWSPPGPWTVRVSPGVGLNRHSHRVLLRVGVSYELSTLRRGGAPTPREER
jgi:hypothetical protein